MSSLHTTSPAPPPLLLRFRSSGFPARAPPCCVSRSSGFPARALSFKHLAPLAPGRGEGQGVRGQTPLPSSHSHTPDRHLFSREDAKPRRKTQRAVRDLAASMPHTRALPCPARPNARPKAPSRSSGFPARALSFKHLAPLAPGKGRGAGGEGSNTPPRFPQPHS